MKTFVGSNQGSAPAQRTFEPSPETSGGAPRNADARAAHDASPAMQASEHPSTPRGPFKFLTIPQAWYDSLHAAPAPDDEPDQEGQ